MEPPSDRDKKLVELLRSIEGLSEKSRSAAILRFVNVSLNHMDRPAIVEFRWRMAEQFGEQHEVMDLIDGRIALLDIQRRR